ncbi:hypothetical protein FDB34_12945 [Clostridium botulinum]|nr:hypothetical protein [Clostridium botulinum]
MRVAVRRFICRNEKEPTEELLKLSLYFSGNEKEFIELLVLIGQIGLEKVEKSITMIEKITPTSVTFDKIKFICQRNENIDFYNDYFKDKESSIINNSINMLNNYSEMLSERKDGVVNEG